MVRVLVLVCGCSACVCVCVSSQDGSTARKYVWVPYECYYHIYSKEDLYKCAAKDGVDWVLAMGDSQERELVALFKMLNGTVEAATKFEQVWSCAGSWSCVVAACRLSRRQWCGMVLGPPPVASA
jgi:hypothetical protein